MISHVAAAVQLARHAGARRCFVRACAPINTRRYFASSSSSPDEQQKHQQQKKSGFSLDYMSWRGVTIASRVVLGMGDFFRYNSKGVFAKGSSDNSRSSMFVLTHFPQHTRVDLQDFVQGAEQVVHTVLQHVYAASDAEEERRTYFETVATEECVEVLAQKPQQLIHKYARYGSLESTRVILEQLNINQVGLAAVDYKSIRLSEEDANQKGYLEEEWLEMEVRFDVTEHLQLASVTGQGIDDRKTINTTFSWTFESNVTDPEQLEWQIVQVTPFVEKTALVVSAEKQ